MQSFYYYSIHSIICENHVSIISFHISIRVRNTVEICLFLLKNLRFKIWEALSFGFQTFTIYDKIVIRNLNWWSFWYFLKSNLMAVHSMILSHPDFREWIESKLKILCCLEVFQSTFYNRAFNLLQYVLSKGQSFFSTNFPISFNFIIILHLKRIQRIEKIFEIYHLERKSEFIVNYHL